MNPEYEIKIIGKKIAVDIELEILKAIHPDEEFELPKMDNAELKLRDTIRRGNRDDMI